MIKVDYISTKDINKVAKIHSSKKYFNWIMKIINNEYRFYPPIVIEKDEDLDDFEFDYSDEEMQDQLFLDDIKEKVIDNNICMFGELWEKGAKFFKEDKFNLVNVLDSNAKMRKIKKGMNRLAKIEQYDVSDTKVSKCNTKLIKKDKFIDISTNDDSYKLYKVKSNKAYNAKIKKYMNTEPMIIENV